MEYLPLMLDVRDRKAIVSGGGPDAEAQARLILKAGAIPYVIADSLTPGLQALAASGALIHAAGAFRATDLDGAALVLLTPGDDMLNHRIYAAAFGRGVPVIAAGGVDLATAALVEAGEPPVSSPEPDRKVSEQQRSSGIIVAIN